MNMKVTVGNSLIRDLMKLREQKGQISIEDVASVLQNMAGELDSGDDITTQFLQQEIAKMAQLIHTAKSDILAMSAADDDESLENATLHLDAVIKSTEEASHIIMDSADAIQEASSGIGGEKEKTISDAVCRIYEACNFQDLTGQRLNKVITLLNQLDERIAKLTQGMPAGKAENAQQKSEEEKLLNGPQLPEGAATQADIDALFSGSAGG